MMTHSTPSAQAPSRITLELCALGFAIFWTAAMLWWTAPQSVASAVSLVIAGALVGIAWYWAMRWWLGFCGLLQDRN